MNNEQPTQAQPSTPSVTPASGVQNEPVVVPVASVGPKKKRPRWIIPVVIAAVVLLVSGGAALAYSLWYQNPDKVVHDAIVNFVKAETITGTSTFAVKDDEMDMSLVIDGKSSSVAGEMNAKLTVEGQTDGAEPVSFTLEGSAIYVDGALYLRLVNVQQTVQALLESSGVGSLPPAMNSIIDRVDGQWVSIKPSDLEEVDDDAAKTQECIAETLEEIQSDEAMRQEVADLYKSNQIIVIKEELGSKKVNDVGSLGYNIELDADATEQVIREMGDTEFGKAILRCDDSLDFSSIADGIRDNAGNDSGAEVRAELWVSRFSHQVTQFSIRGESTPDDAKVEILMEPVFNQEVAVEAPADAVPLTEFIEDISGAIFELTYGASRPSPLMDSRPISVSEYSFN